MANALTFKRDGLPYCEKDYQRQFGVKCDHCERFIAGKVLQVYLFLDSVTQNCLLSGALHLLC